MKIALLCNLRPCAVRTGELDDAYEEYDSATTIESIIAALRAPGRTVEPVFADQDLPRRLEEGRYDFAFNIAEGPLGRRCREAIAPAVCELIGLPCTGSDVLTLALTLDKAMSRRAVSPEIPVARGVLIEGAEDWRRLTGLQYPVLVKPNDEGSSKGIRNDPIAHDFDAAWRRCAWLQERYGCRVLVEEFLPGPEVTIGVAGNGPGARVIGMMEIAPIHQNGPFVYSLEMKRDFTRLVRYHQPPRLSGETIALIERNALMAYRLLGCRDLARLDFRLDATGRPHFLECNPLPGLDPESGDIVILSRSTLGYEQLIQGFSRTPWRAWKPRATSRRSSPPAHSPSDKHEDPHPAYDAARRPRGWPPA